MSAYGIGQQRTDDPGRVAPLALITFAVEMIHLEGPL